MDNSTALIDCAKRLYFPDDLEKLFREDYYNNSSALCRGALVVSVLIWMIFGFLDPYAVPSETSAVWFIRFGIVTPLLWGFVLTSFFPIFRRIMQPLASMELLPAGIGVIAMACVSRPGELGYMFYPMGLLLVCMVGYCFLRLRFWYAALANGILVAVYLISAIAYQQVFSVAHGIPIFLNNAFFILAANCIGAGACYSLEFNARQAFIANYLLDQERMGEQRKRERTEGMLQILSQAIGGVVHDLGNPLASVQTGAQTLAMFLDSGDTDPELLKEFAGIILEGAEMLNHLRLSLMEQTRVLEGKPIPVELKAVAIRNIVEAGIHYQKPRFVNDRTVVLSGDEVHVQADVMKLTTVFMNLIGNALKYSDGEVHILWCAANANLLIAVADEGRAGAGITKAQADQLFVPFGRLDVHVEVEGTGLGLLSVRKVVEAHGGEVFIEGRLDGTRTSAAFVTTANVYPSMLKDNHCTAFVVVCPLSPQTDNLPLAN